MSSFEEDRAVPGGAGEGLTAQHEPYLGLSVRLKAKEIPECLGLIRAVQEPGETPLAVFRSDAVTYRFLLITSMRTLGLDIAHKRKPEKAKRQVVSNRDIKEASAVRIGFSVARLRLTLNTGAIEEYGGLQRREIDDIAAWVENSSSPERVAALQAVAESQHSEQAEWEVAFANAPVYGERINRATRKEIAANCRAGELPRFIIGSWAAGALAGFDDRCILVKKGVITNLMAGSLGGGRVSTFLYSEITGIEYNSGFMSGVLEILTASYSGTSNKDFWRGTFSSSNANADDPFTLSNTLPLNKSVYERVRPQVEELKRLVAEAKSPRVTVEVPTTSASSAYADSLAAEIELLAGLRERGLLDDEEFKAAKLTLIEKMRDS